MALMVSRALRPHQNEQACGDQSAWWQKGNRLVFAMVDGLGHGDMAAHAASTAIHCVGRHLDADCKTLFAECDSALASTRGAAVALAIIELGEGKLEIASVGNIRTRLLGAQRDLRLGGARGIIGAGYRDLAPESLTLESQDTLVFFTDGIDEFANLRPVLNTHHALDNTVAEKLVETFGRWDDDVGVLVFRYESCVAQPVGCYPREP